jgi:Calcineurin-like phosphoesterase
MTVPDPHTRSIASTLLLGAVLQCQSLLASPHKIDDYHWDHVDRVVAIGDLHGDYANYIRVLEAAGIIDARGQWIAGETHVVQLGDVPDRGDDTEKIIAHLRKLATQARAKGGWIHTLLGNHEAMNTYGDLRYVTAGNFAAFAGRDAPQWRDRYYENVLTDMKAREPERFASLPPDFRETWNATHPLGWVEHQRGWNPQWNPKGEYFEWALQDQVAIQINDLIFLHGGISGAYCQNTLASLTEMARAALRKGDSAAPSVLTDENGPLWYRGLAGVEPVAAPETVQAILEHNGAHHIVIGHTPTHGVIWPRYSGRVIQADTGISAYHGGHVAWLEETSDGLYAGYLSGKIRLPSDDAGRIEYLKKVVALQPENAGLQKQLSALEKTPNGDDDTHETAQDATKPASAAGALPICGISP